MTDLIKYWLPVAVWAGVIFLFSNAAFSSPHTAGFFGPWLSRFTPEITPEQIETLHHLMRKLGHWVEYFVLSLLFARAVRNDGPSLLRETWALWTIAFVVVSAAGDEFHQSFVPTRSASVGDVLIDSFGGLCGVFWIYLRDRRAGRPPKPSKNLTSRA